MQKHPGSDLGGKVGPAIWDSPLPVKSWRNWTLLSVSDAAHGESVGPALGSHEGTVCIDLKYARKVTAAGLKHRC